MSVVMDMSSYEVEPGEMEYGEEVLCSGWNPALTLACAQAVYPEMKKPLSMPPELASVDAEIFLQTMYACQR